MKTMHVITGAVLAGLILLLLALPAGAQGLRSGEEGEMVPFVDVTDIPEGSTCEVTFSNNESSHAGNVAVARSSLEREVEADFEDGNGELVVLTIESDGRLFAGVRLGSTGGTSTDVTYSCEQLPPPPTTTTTTTTAATTTTTIPVTTTVPPPPKLAVTGNRATTGLLALAGLSILFGLVAVRLGDE